MRGRMTLQQAIEHAEEVARNEKCEECKNQHKQLVEWLKELEERRLKEN